MAPDTARTRVCDMPHGQTSGEQPLQTDCFLGPSLLFGARLICQVNFSGRPDGDQLRKKYLAVYFEQIVS